MQLNDLSLRCTIDAEWQGPTEKMWFPQVEFLVLHRSPLVNVYRKLWQDPPFFMAKSPFFMAKSTFTSHGNVQ